jgi:hypothetical protein
MDVLEHFLHKAFVVPAHEERLDADAQKVKEVVPPRKARTKSKLQDRENGKQALR